MNDNSKNERKLKHTFNSFFISQNKKARMASFALFLVVLGFLVLLFFKKRVNPIDPVSPELLDIPIDVVYKYIDLRDKNLKRKGIPQVVKDFDNEELRYSIRSVLKNVPWIRKIFIIMPNENVSFINKEKDVENRIVYIKDKDLIGFDSSSSTTFEHNGLHRLDEFGVSEYFLYMNDDYFIGKPLRKEDFFYYSMEEKRVVPYVSYLKEGISRTNYYKMLYFYYIYKDHFKEPCSHSHLDYLYQNVNTYMLLYKYFKRRNILIPDSIKKTWHNTVPFSITDLKELHNFVKENYEFSDVTFNSICRSNKQLTHEPLYAYYFLNKYNRKRLNFRSMYINIRFVYFNYQRFFKLFCLNTVYNKITNKHHLNTRIYMMSTFPNRTSFEIPEMEDGVYYMKSYKHPNLYFDTNCSDLYTRTRVCLNQFTGGDSQKFVVEYNGKGTYSIKTLDLRHSLRIQFGYSPPRFSHYITNDVLSERELFFIVPQPEDTFMLVSKRKNLLLSEWNKEKKGMRKLFFKKFSDDNNQRFCFMKSPYKGQFTQFDF